MPSLGERTRSRPFRRARRERLVTPVFLLVTLSTFAYFLSVGAILPVLPHYIKDVLGGGEIGVGLGIGSFGLSAVVLRPIVGRIGDRRGRTLLMAAGAGIVAASVAGYLVANSLARLMVMRLINGVGEAAFFVGAATAVSDLAPDDRRGEATSLFSLALYAGIAVGPVIGEVLLDHSGFAAVWWFSTLAAAVAALIATRVPDTRPPGAANRPPGPLIHPAGILPGVVMATSVAGFAAFSSFVPLYAETLGLRGSRFAYLEYAAIVLAIRSVGARLPDVLGPARAATASLAISTVGLSVMALWARPEGLYTGTALLAMGTALAFPALATLALRGAAPEERGAVLGTFSAFFDLSFGLGALTAGGVAEVLGYRGAFLAASGVAAIGFVVMMTARTTRPAPG